MNVLSELKQLKFLVNGEIKEAWLVYLESKKEEDTGNINCTGMFSSCDSLYLLMNKISLIEDSIIEFYDQRNRSYKILLDKIEQGDY